MLVLLSIYSVFPFTPFLKLFLFSKYFLNTIPLRIFLLLKFVGYSSIQYVHCILKIGNMRRLYDKYPCLRTATDANAANSHKTSSFKPVKMFHISFYRVDLCLQLFERRQCFCKKEKDQFRSMIRFMFFTRTLLINPRWGINVK